MSNSSPFRLGGLYRALTTWDLGVPPLEEGDFFVMLSSETVEDRVPRPEDLWKVSILVRGRVREILVHLNEIELLEQL